MTLQLEAVCLQNFRCFDEHELWVPLHSDLTVFVANNAQGKTAVLEGICHAVNPFVDILSTEPKSEGITRDDVRRILNEQGNMDQQFPSVIRGRGTVVGSEIEWYRERTSVAPRTRTRDTHSKPLRDLANAVAERLDEREVDLPVFAYYDARRTASIPDDSDDIPLKQIPDRGTGYRGHLKPLFSFDKFVKWYGGLAWNIKKLKPAIDRIEFRPELHLAVVNDAVRQVLEPTGWCNLHWDYDLNRLMIENQDRGRLPLSTMSDGVRNTISIVADIAHRCCRLNPQYASEAARETAGVILIDEVDLHLHPSWQQLVIGLLGATFPKIQLVLTNHIPQHVLTSSNYVRCPS
ncbi:MAG: AAA family ATPase [Planctomycetota bacterium]